MNLRFVKNLLSLLTTHVLGSKLDSMWHESLKEYLKSNLNYSSLNLVDAPPLNHKEDQMQQSLNNLSQQDVELAFQLLNRLWELPQPFLAQREIPESLQHLDEQDWQILGAALETLYEQREQSSLH